jgi:hypothetical protein
MNSTRTPHSSLQVANILHNADRLVTRNVIDLVAQPTLRLEHDRGFSQRVQVLWRRDGPSKRVVRNILELRLGSWDERVNRLNSRMKSWASMRKAFLAILRLRDRTTHLINASSPQSLILTVSLLWFNFRIARQNEAAGAKLY